jgi:hypothetical protein
MGQGVGLALPPRGDHVSRLAALVLLTAAFAPAAVLGAMPVVAPVVVFCVAVAMAVAAFDRAPEPVPVETAKDASTTP